MPAYLAMPKTHSIRKAAGAIAATLALLSASATIAHSKDGPIWTMVTDQAGLGDHGFNDLAKKGLDLSVEQLGGVAKVIQSTDQSQFVPNLQQSVNNGSKMTVGVGFLIKDSLTEVATKNPKAYFTLIDAVSADKSGKPLGNVASVTFREQEGAFLAGIVAGMTTKADRVGFIGGMETPPVIRFMAGYEAGIHYVNPDIKVNVAYVGSFRDPAKAKELALGIFDVGADVIMDVAGGGGRGIFDAAKEQGADHWVIGADTCKGRLAPDNFLTSAVKDVAGAVLYEDKAAAAGTFKGGPVSLGLKQKAVGLCPDNINTLSAKIRAKVDTATAAILDGSLVVPATEKELKTFKSTTK